jgi:hypothetical protein
MKKFVLLLTLPLAGLLQAQSSFILTDIVGAKSILANSTVSLTTKAGLTTGFDVDITNTTNVQHTYILKRYDIVLNVVGTSTAFANFCFNGACTGSDVVISSPKTLNGGQSAAQTGTDNQIMTADLQEADAKGYSLIKYTFVNTANSADSIQFKIQYNTAPLGAGIAGVSGTEPVQHIFPSVTRDQLNFETAGKQGTIQIFDLTGAQVYSRESTNANGEILKINTSSFAAGLYVFKFEGTQERYNAKFVVTR